MKQNTTSTNPASCLHELFEAQAERTPNKTAVFCEDQVITYAALNERANQVANHLKGLGIGPDVPVALCVERSIEMIIGLFGILKAGGSYVPLDEEYPVGRLDYMLKDTESQVVITQERLTDRLSNFAGTLVCLDRDSAVLDGQSKANLKATASPNHLVYIIYTSGSTGQPKGVMVEHQSVVDYVRTYNDFFVISPDDCQLTLASISFDASVEEIFSVLSAGGSLVVCPQGRTTDISHIARLIEKHKVTLLSAPPALLNLLNRERLEDISGSTVRLILTGGDSLHAADVDQLIKTIPVANGYGVTECSIASTYHVFTEINGQPVHIGKPMPNREVYILDEKLQRVLPGEKGEIFLGGVGLARGYLNRAEETEARFVRHPFSSDDNARIYRTGDLGRVLPDGNIEFLGRSDQQVSLRGYRIELGEIETVLRQHPGVQDAAVAIQESGQVSGGETLVAYVVADASRSSAGAAQNACAAPNAGTQVELWPSVAEFPEINDELLYYAMVNCPHRIGGYREALNRLVKDKIVVDLGSGNDAVLSRMSVEAGAKKVYAIELLEEACDQARVLIDDLGLKDRITVVHGDCTKVQLPEQVDVCITAMNAHLGGAAGIATIVNDARRFLKPDGIMIPHRNTTKIAAVQLPEELSDRPAFTELTAHYTAKIFDFVGRPFDLRLCIKNFPHHTHVISDSDVFEDLLFTDHVEPEHEREIALRINKDARLDGLLVWLNLEPAEGQVIDTLGLRAVWIPVYFPVFHPGIDVQKGDTISAVCRGELSDNRMHPNYSIKGTLQRNDGEPLQFAYESPFISDSFKGNGFYEELFSQDWQRRSEKLTHRSLSTFLSEHLPEYMIPSRIVFGDALPLTENGKVDRRALSTMNVPALSQQREIVGPRNPVESDIAVIWAELLNLDEQELSVHDYFCELGGDSLTFVEMAVRMRRAWSLDIPLEVVVCNPTIAEQAQALQDRLEMVETSE